MLNLYIIEYHISKDQIELLHLYMHHQCFQMHMFLLYQFHSPAGVGLLPLPFLEILKKLVEFARLLFKPIFWCSMNII